MYRLFVSTFPLAILLALCVTAAAQEVELLNFTADSCPACRQMEPVLQNLAAAGAPVRRVDVNRERDLAGRFGVQYLPTFVAVANGREIERQVGATSAEHLRQMLQRAEAAQSQQSQETRDKRQEPDQRQETRDGRQEARGERQTPEPFHQASSPALNSQPSTLNSPGSLDSRLIAASVRLRVEDPQGISYGTGTVISSRGDEAIVLTCGHLFRESRGKLPVQVELFAQESSAPRVADVVQGEVLAYDLTRDLGLVRIRPARPIHSMPVAPRNTTLRPGEPAASVGCDNGKNPTVWHTRVTAINRYVGPANVEAAGTPVQGRSGGGLFSDRGELIGVCFAADDQGNEGLYVGLPAIYEELDRLQLDVAPQQRPAAAAVAAAPPAAADPFAGEAEPTHVAGPLVPVSTAAAVSESAVTAGQILSPEEAAALEEISQRSGGGEVIVIIRPKAPGDRCEILSLQNPSAEFVGQLTALGNKAVQPRFTTERQARPLAEAAAAAQPREATPRTTGTTPQRGRTAWKAVLPGER